MATYSNPNYVSLSNHGIAEKRVNVFNNQNALFALKAFSPGDVIADFWPGSISTSPTYLTLQIEQKKHITLQPEFLQYINHSCNPNVFFDCTLMKLVALKEIMLGEEMTFFYPSTEWKMTQPFQCFCGHINCLGEIRGAAFLNDELLKSYRVTDFIQQQLAKRAAKKVA